LPSFQVSALPRKGKDETGAQETKIDTKTKWMGKIGNKKRSLEKKRRGFFLPERGSSYLH